MSGHLLPKKPKIEIIIESDEEDPEEEEEEAAAAKEEDPEEEEPEEENDDAKADEQKKDEEALLLVLVEHHKKEVENLRQRLTYFQSQLDEAEKRLEGTENKLACLRGHNIKKESKTLTNGKEEKKVESSASPTTMIEGSSQKMAQSAPLHQYHDTTEPSASQKQTRPRPPLVIPSLASRTFPQLMKAKESGDKFSSSVSQSTSSTHLTKVNTKVELPCKLSSGQETMGKQPKGTKRKLDEQEHRDLIKLISKNSSPGTIRCQTGCLLPSQHKRRLRSLVLCQADDKLFITSALDGIVNLWEVEGKGSSAKLLSSTDCQSDKKRKWPEDIAWHPRGNRVFSVYSADGEDSQVSILNLNKVGEKSRVSFLKDKPHVKGIINSIMFMPWDEKSFVTGGSDHAVFLWSEEDGGRDSWKPKLLHKEHSSAVMGIAGLYHKNIVMSGGADKRIVGYDAHTGKPEYKRQMDGKCMSILPNPCDFNLFMVHTGTYKQQLRLFDIRVRQDEVHAFGWKQESSESQSALINQSWSPDGLYITSGSADPIIHIFDIRFNGHKPSQSIRAHHKRVFKAAWHHTLPLMISISSDQNIALHKIT